MFRAVWNKCRTILEQFQSDFRALSERFQSDFKFSAISEQLQNDPRANSERIHISFKANSQQFQSSFRAVLLHRDSSAWELPKNPSRILQESFKNPEMNASHTWNNEGDWTAAVDRWRPALPSLIDLIDLLQGHSHPPPPPPLLLLLSIFVPNVQPRGNSVNICILRWCRILPD